MIIEKELLNKCLDALILGHEYAAEQAVFFHESMEGYRKKEHELIDNDVIMIGRVINDIKELINDKRNSGH